MWIEAVDSIQTARCQRCRLKNNPVCDRLCKEEICQVVFAACMWVEKEYKNANRREKEVADLNMKKLISG